MNVTAVKYHEGMSKALDGILSKGDIRKAWIVRNDKYAAEIVIADSKEDAIRRYENLLRMRLLPPSPPREAKVGRPKKV